MDRKIVLASSLMFPLSVLLGGCAVTDSGYPASQPDYPPPSQTYGAYDDDYEISAREPPPPLPYYEQPRCPGPGYIWTPGYWSYDGDGGYYWVPGTWTRPPQPDLYWTPGYWAWSGNAYVFHAGYWSPRVGYYGGVNYGHGYDGYGYQGGRWDNGQFHYNRAVNNVDVTTIHNTYNTTVINNVTVNNVSYNGGPGGTTARPTAEREVPRDRRVRPTSEQLEHQRTARSERALYQSRNQGRPPIAATPRPGALDTGQQREAQQQQRKDDREQRQEDRQQRKADREQRREEKRQQKEEKDKEDKQQRRKKRKPDEE